MSIVVVVVAVVAVRDGGVKVSIKRGRRVRAERVLDLHCTAERGVPKVVFCPYCRLTAYRAYKNGKCFAGIYWLRI